MRRHRPGRGYARRRVYRASRRAAGLRYPVGSRALRAAGHHPARARRGGRTVAGVPVVPPSRNPRWTATGQLWIYAAAGLGLLFAPIGTPPLLRLAGGCVFWLSVFALIYRHRH